MAKGYLKICSKGHRYYKSSDCPTCPICEREKRPDSGLLAIVSAPVRRAFEERGIDTAAHLSRYSEKDILAWHGVGPASLPKLRKYLKEEGLSFK